MYASNVTVFVKLRCSAGVGKGWADGLGAVLFLLWKVGVLRGVAHRTSGLRAWPPLGSQHWVRADGVAKRSKQVAPPGNGTRWVLGIV